jgi:hypothetical protein
LVGSYAIAVASGISTGESCSVLAEREVSGLRKQASLRE